MSEHYNIENLAVLEAIWIKSKKLYLDFKRSEKSKDSLNEHKITYKEVSGGEEITYVARCFEYLIRYDPFGNINGLWHYDLKVGTEIDLTPEEYERIQFEINRDENCVEDYIVIDDVDEKKDKKKHHASLLLVIIAVLAATIILVFLILVN